MNDYDLLLAQTRHVYHWLTSATSDVDFDAARFSFGERPSIAWLVGHMLINAESTAAAVTGLDRELEEQGSLPHWGCKVPADWADLRTKWSLRSEQYLGALKSLPPSDLDAPPLIEIIPDFKDKLTDRRRFWSGHVFHMGYHLGQVGTLRAELGLGWWT